MMMMMMRVGGGGREGGRVRKVFRSAAVASRPCNKSELKVKGLWKGGDFRRRGRGEGGFVYIFDMSGILW